MSKSFEGTYKDREWIGPLECVGARHGFDAGRASRDEEHKAEVAKLVAAGRYLQVLVRDAVRAFPGAQEIHDRDVFYKKHAATLAAYPAEEAPVAESKPEPSRPSGWRDDTNRHPAEGGSDGTH